MKTNYPNNIFITGTGTGVGKTVVSAVMVAGLKASYWKPVQSGLTGQTDTEIVKEITGLSDEYFLPEIYRLSQPLSPHASATIDNISIELDNFHLPKLPKHSRLIVEGAGGIMVPLNEKYFMLDLMKKLQLPVVLVASSGLGTINHTLLSLQMLRSNNLEILGVVMNGTQNESNKRAIEHYGRVQVLAELEEIPDFNSVNLKKEYSKCFSQPKRF